MTRVDSIAIVVRERPQPVFSHVWLPFGAPASYPKGVHYLLIERVVARLARECRQLVRFVLLLLPCTEV